MTCREPARVSALEESGATALIACSSPIPLFFSSRSRHPSCSRDWSSDVCSSDLVVPGYAVWDEPLGRYRLRFEPPVELTRTGDEESDILENTQKFAKVLEEVIRKYPDQWVWIHGRWNTRPNGEPPVYDFS